MVPRFPFKVSIPEALDAAKLGVGHSLTEVGEGCLETEGLRLIVERFLVPRSGDGDRHGQRTGRLGQLR
jgi:hypothetical protein